ncbi:hypothetical protein ASG25_07565 [Rhizobium sp. Leaf384]|nr:hypothetical protein ASG25_07565 [Rhizobium sp. Leaf384]KQS87225.1 hypothetical protein ASG58_03125 [Rhizobium sp. Leaf383]
MRVSHAHMKGRILASGPFQRRYDVDDPACPPRMQSADDAICCQGDMADAVSPAGMNEAVRLLRADIPTLTTRLESLSP